MSGYRHDSRKHGRRDSRSPSRHRREGRRSSPGPSSRHSPRPDQLPEQFGRLPEKREEDDSTVLQCMKKSFVYNPLGCLTKCVEENRKIKVWTRNFREVRGICTGNIIAFDKHWNLVLSDVNEVYLKPRKSKTPFLYDIKSGENFPELGPKVPRQKKEVSQESVPVPEMEVKTPPPAEEESGTKAKKKKKKRKKTTTAQNRFMRQCFIRGDNIVMVAVISLIPEKSKGADTSAVQAEEETKTEK